MKKRHLILILSAVALASLSGCTKDKPTEPAPLETIAPDITTSEGDDLNDKLDDTSAPDLDISSYVVGPNGEKLTGDEAIAYEEEMLYGTQNSSSEVSDSLTETKSQYEDGTGEIDESASVSLTESTSQSQDGSGESTSQSESQSESVPVDVASDQRDFTNDEYQQLQNEIDDWTSERARTSISIE